MPQSFAVMSPIFCNVFSRAPRVSHLKTFRWSSLLFWCAPSSSGGQVCCSGVLHLHQVVKSVVLVCSIFIRWSSLLFWCAPSSSDGQVCCSVVLHLHQVVKSVVLLCSIFIISQLKFVPFSATRVIVPDFDDFTRMEPLFGMISQINNTCTYLNTPISIFVYYNYNSKYRSVLCSIFCGNSKERDFKIHNE